MSVTSSQITSVASMLRDPKLRSELVTKSSKVYFKLPTDIKTILYNFQIGNSREYENLIKLLRDGTFSDINFAEFLDNLKHYVASLNDKHDLLIQILLGIQWVNKSPEVICNYKLFLQDLICTQTSYLKPVISGLINLLKPVSFSYMVENKGKFEINKLNDKDIEKLDHIFDVLCKILEIVPMSNEFILHYFEYQFPYVLENHYTYQAFIYLLLKLMEYIPTRRSDILLLIINKLMVLDVHIPRKTVKDKEENDVNDEDSFEVNDDNEGDNNDNDDDDDDDDKTIHPIAHTLDICMELFLKYMHKFCFKNDVVQTESVKILYMSILRIFETIILTTHASQCVQYIMLYICSFKDEIAEMFINWLWTKMTNPNMSLVLRQSAAYYISSMCANASFIPHRLVKLMMSLLVNWIQNYIKLYRHKNLGYIEENQNTLFYYVCQGFFHLFIARYEEFIALKNGLLFLQILDISNIINCELNPLKKCDSQIVNNFAKITNMYQLAYCYTVIENNERHQLFALQKKESADLCSNVFPFESYPWEFQHSERRILPLLRYNVKNAKQHQSVSNRHSSH